MTDFTGDFQTGEAPAQVNAYSNRMVFDEYEQDTTTPEVSAPRKKNKNILNILLVVILVIAIVVVLSKILIKNSDMFPFSSSKNVTTTERPPVTVQKNIEKSPAMIDEKNDIKSPVLRDELPGTTSDVQLKK